MKLQRGPSPCEPRSSHNNTECPYNQQIQRLFSERPRGMHATISKRVMCRVRQFLHGSSETQEGSCPSSMEAHTSRGLLGEHTTVYPPDRLRKHVCLPFASHRPTHTKFNTPLIMSKATKLQAARRNAQTPTAETFGELPVAHLSAAPLAHVHLHICPCSRGGDGHRDTHMHKRHQRWTWWRWWWPRRHAPLPRIACSDRTVRVVNPEPLLETEARGVALEGILQHAQVEIVPCRLQVLPSIPRRDRTSVYQVGDPLARYATTRATTELIQAKARPAQRANLRASLRHGTRPHTETPNRR